ncbi:MAG: hypothetical protein ABW049_06110 [Spongiibacteraceae bacterium]
MNSLLVPFKHNGYMLCLIAAALLGLALPGPGSKGGVLRPSADSRSASA